MRLRAKLLSACIFFVSCNGISHAAPEELPELAHARALLRQGKLADAEAALRSFLSGHLVSADARFLLAYTLFRENKPRESLSEYTHAAQLQRPAADDLHNVALDYVLLNDYADADTWMTRATEWMPTNGEYWYDLGRIKAMENRFADAVHCFTQALKYQPRSVKAENNLGIAYGGLNRTDEAVAAYRQAIAWASDAPAAREGSPDSAAQPMLQLAAILTDRSQLAEAQALLEKAQVLEPHDARIHKALGLLYERKGDLAESQRAFENAVSESPEDASLHFQLGTVYRKRGLSEKAQSEFARAAQLNGTHSTPAP